MTVRQISRERRESGVTAFPALRMMNTSPGSSPSISSGGMRESMQVSTTALAEPLTVGLPRYLDIHRALPRMTLSMKRSAPASSKGGVVDITTLAQERIF